MCSKDAKKYSILITRKMLHPLHARYCPEHYIHVNSFNPNYKHSYFKGGNGRKESFISGPRTVMVNRGAKIQTHAVSTQCFFKLLDLLG